MKQIIRKYFIMGSQNCPRRPEVILKEALKAGITAFQYREKGLHSLTGTEKINLGLSLRELCRQYNVPFFINDDVELIETLDVDGIHVGQDDMSVKEIRKQFPHIYIGLSISNEQELKSSLLEYVDYIGAGPMFTTTTKSDAKGAVGTEWITTLRRKYTSLPIVGIGGITEDNAFEVLQSGANGVAVISTITSSKNIQKTVKAL